MHHRCLQDWQQVRRAQGQFRQARQCEICRQPYKLPTVQCGGGGSGRWDYLKQLLSRSSTHVLDMLSCQSWGALAYRAWKLYVLGSSVVGAAQAGAAGLRAGFGMGKTLVVEQTSILLGLLNILGEMLGTPFAELLWCQAVACVAFALVSEVLYASVLGLVAGGVVGFCRGYMGAVQASFALATQGVVRTAHAGRSLAKAAGMALRMPWFGLKGLLLGLARSLPVRIL
ncbi:hypothetical protein CHLRE_09g389000v5 [Chlamydomonas reinhardtii]|uniref:RING-CH-type domain-containing protein n=1 Tax=Chlamydomonas reinhardtii TaxID=3055 RepID=A0A2K3DDM7_CHLRE|nr:uncharacterized protein CHLRE_09g389000v5 [Chlamydomonas reinhardtii]PNW78635.1 hypothetical protein CHLRE_09g389000v5 [Chlamydomonas reinhardtii]